MQILVSRSFDLNNPRRINDSRGHEAGDAYIRRFAICLRASMPAEQFVGRAGGDEFLAVTHGLDREQMTQCLEKGAQRYERGIQSVSGYSRAMQQALHWPAIFPEVQ